MAFRLLPIALSTILFAILATVVCLAADDRPAPPIGPTVVVYVSPSGDDAGPGTIDKPLKTIARARDAIRELKKADAARRFAVELRGGRYYATEPIILDERDSGENEYPVTYRNYQGETPVLVGGVQVAGWEPYKGRVFRAMCSAVKSVKPGDIDILENDVPGAVARTPNEGWLRLENPIAEPFWSFCYKKGDFDPSKIDTSQLQVHYIQVGTYFSEHIPIERIDPKERRMYTHFKMWDKAYNPIEGKTYVFENALQFLDEPGEFYVDHKTGFVYYIPTFKDIKSACVETSMVESVVKFMGSSEAHPVHDVVLEGIYIQGGRTQVYTDNATRITIRDCRLFNAKTSGVCLADASSYVTVTGCEVAGSGSDGIRIGGKYKVQGPGKAYVPNHDNVVHNNYVHHAGRLSITGCGIALIQGGNLIQGTNNNIISHNQVTDTTKSGVFMFSVWDVPRERQIMAGNVIKNNVLARCVVSSTDGGSFYIGASTDNTTFENNLVMDAWSWFNTTWPQPEDRSDDVQVVDFDPGAPGCYNTFIRNNIFGGENATSIEKGRFEDEFFVSNNFFECSAEHQGEFMLDGKWYKIDEVQKGSFDPSKVSKDIGLTKDYKYPHPTEMMRPLKFPLYCGFEGTLSPFYLYRYSDGLRQEYFTSTNVQGGKTALRVDKDVFVVRYRNPSPVSKKVTVWMYDDPSKKSAACFATLRGPGAIEDAVASIGVDGRVSSDRYVIQALSDRTIATPVKRTAGWHKLEFDVKESGGCILTLDGQEVGKVYSLKAFRIIDLGDPWFGSDSVGLGFDSLSIE